MAATENVLDAPIAAMDFSRYFQLRAESVADLLRETDDELYDDGDDGCALVFVSVTVQVRADAGSC